MIEQMLLLTVVVKVTLLMSLMHVVCWLLEHIALLLLQICFGNSRGLQGGRSPWRWRTLCPGQHCVVHGIER